MINIKLSMYILERWFQEAGYQTYSAIVDGRAKLVGARITEENPGDAIAGVALKDDNSGLVAIVNRNDILFISNATSTAVLNKASEAFEYYNNWEMCLLRSAFEKSSLQDILDIAVLAMRRPMLIKNSRKELCAFTASYGPYVHPLWSEYLKLEKLPAPVYDYGKPYNELVDVSEKEEPTILYSPSYKGNFLFANLIVNGHRLGHISAYEHNRPFDKGDVQLMTILQRIITFYVSANQGVLYSDSPISDFLYSALTDGTYAAYTPDELMKKYHWSEADALILILLRPDESLPAPVINGQIEALNQVLPHLNQAAIDKNYIFLFNMAPFENFDSLLEALRSTIEAGSYHWSVSNPFHGLASLKGHYEAAAAALSYTIKKDLPGTTVSSLGAVHWQKKLNVSAEELACWGHPAYLFLSKYDVENDTRYLDTLFWYLYYNRNLMNASTKLGLHRNTVNNWVVKLFEQLGNDPFDETLERLSFVFTYLSTHELTEQPPA